MRLLRAMRELEKTIHEAGVVKSTAEASC
jgi:hypothetical protein